MIDVKRIQKMAAVRRRDDYGEISFNFCLTLTRPGGESSSEGLSELLEAILDALSIVFKASSLSFHFINNTENRHVLEDGKSSSAAVGQILRKAKRTFSMLGIEGHILVSQGSRKLSIPDVMTISIYHRTANRYLVAIKLFDFSWLLKSDDKIDYFGSTPSYLSRFIDAENGSNLSNALYEIQKLTGTEISGQPAIAKAILEFRDIDRRA